MSSLFLVLTLIAYARWQWGGRSAAAFIVCAWCWFQVDYGTVLPVVAVLFLEALVADTRAFWRTVGAGAILAATLAPFVWFYDLLHRGSDADGTWGERARHNLFNTNEYVIPVLVGLAVVYLLARNWKSLPVPERRTVSAGCAVIAALTFWIPTVTVYSFVRYVIIAVPVGAMLTAWLLVRLFGRDWKLAWLSAAVLIFTPWLSVPMRAIAHAPEWWTGSVWYRAELKDLRDEIFGHQPDPNRIAIDWLRKNAAPTDEILINYEDLPLIYYPVSYTHLSRRGRSVRMARISWCGTPSHSMAIVVTGSSGAFSGRPVIRRRNLSCSNLISLPPASRRADFTWLVNPPSDTADPGQKCTCM